MSNNHDDARGREDAPLGAASSSSARQAVREKAQQVKAKQARARVARIAAIAVVLVAVIAAVAVVVTMTVSRDASKPQVQPAGIDDDGIRVTAASAAMYTELAAKQSEDPQEGADGATATAPPTPTPTPTETEAADAPASNPVEVRVYVDYLSGGSGTFQATNAEQLAGLVEAGAVTLTYHPVAMLTANSNGTKYSLRAASAAACVATIAPETFFSYNTELLSKQPEPETDGYSNAELADMALALGVGKNNADRLRKCIDEGRYDRWVKSSTERALKENLPGTDAPLATTPTILVNGTPYLGALDDGTEFSQSILDADSNAYFQTPTPEVPGETPEPSGTPTPTPTPSS